MNPIASVIMLVALIFYSVGVWSERIQGRLKLWHLILFIFGLICDTTGTTIMFDYVGGMVWNIHGISGMLAIILMIIHAIWASVVLIRKDENMILKFHKFSIFVWIVWLIPYFSPMFIQILK